MGSLVAANYMSFDIFNLYSFCQIMQINKASSIVLKRL